MKKLLSLALCLALVLSAVSALALNYNGSQDNAPTFELLEETRLTSPDAVKDLETNVGKTFVSHPVLDGYTEGTTYVYRSANMYGGRAAARLNTDILVFTEQHFDSKDDAKAYIADLGLIDIIDEAIGSVILVTPADGIAFGAQDQKNYYALQTAILAQKESGKDAEGNTVTYSDAEYMGGYGYLYVIGIDGGATFLNNYVAGTFDFVSRIAGMLLVGGKMDAISSVAALVPTYLVDAKDDVIAKYKAANDADAYAMNTKTEIYYNQAQPLQKVCVALQEKSLPEHIRDAYYDLFVKAMRVPVVKGGLYTAATPYQGYGFDQAPYSLFPRNAVIDDVTADGIHLLRFDSDTQFADVKMQNGAYLQTWFEYLPTEVLENTAPEHSIPLILANHGGGDDPRVFVDEIGLLNLIGRERIAVVAPEEQSLWSETVDGQSVNGICCEILPAIAKYMLEKYPALDPSRVYTLGYSMGGGATLKALNGDPALFAAGACMAASSYVATEEQAAVYETVDLPLMLMTSTFDMVYVYAFDTANNTIGSGFEKQIRLFTRYNSGMTPVDDFDYEKYPIIGIPVDSMTKTLVNNEYTNYQWRLNNDDGVPMIAVNLTENLVHALYPAYAEIFWDYAKHFSRVPETAEIVYNPYVD